MRSLKIFALVLELSALAAIVACRFTDWNNVFCLPLGLCLCSAGNILYILSVCRCRGEKQKSI